MRQKFSLTFSLYRSKKASDGSTARHFFDKLFHVVGAALFHLLRHMSIDIQRKRRCRVSKVPLHRLDIITGMDRGNCVAVAKIVETSLGHSYLGCEFAVPPDVLMVRLSSCSLSLRICKIVRLSLFIMGTCGRMDMPKLSTTYCGAALHSRVSIAMRGMQLLLSKS